VAKIQTLKIKMDYIKLIRNEFPLNPIFSEEGYKLIIMLGAFGDFDSFEYAQNIYRHLGELKKNNINLMIIGIGDNDSKAIFSEYTGIPAQLISNIEDNTLHRKLNLNNMTYFRIPTLLNMLLICAGINSPGTLQEVLRGYTGNKSSLSILSTKTDFIYTRKLLIKPYLFDLISERKHLIPFELATLRLNNMFEVLYNWKTYIPNINNILQRGGTFFYNDKEELIYKFINKSLLVYSETMNKPLSFIDSTTNFNLYPNNETK
tara:strand:- start:457 stop:1242 length:786 start_codon:yes stop_codon:yes gene_type:complete